MPATAMVPPVGRSMRAEHEQQGGLAAAGRAHDQHDLAGGDVEVDVADGGDGEVAFAEGLGEVLGRAAPVRWS